MMFWAFRIATSGREGRRERERDRDRDRETERQTETETERQRQREEEEEEEEEEGKKAEIYRKIQWNPLVQLQRCLALFSINRDTKGLGSPGFSQ